MKNIEYVWVISCILAIVTHELGHVLAIRLFGIRRGKISVAFWGISMEAQLFGVSAAKKLAVYLAGSAANIVCALIFKSCSFSLYAYGLFNLLPAKFLDGGEVLRVILEMIISNQKITERILNIATLTVTLTFWIVSLYLALNKAGTALLVTSIYMIVLGQFWKRT